MRTWQRMIQFTNARVVDPAAYDNQIWFVEHDPVFTLGRAGRMEHLKQATTIPVVRTDRGGQITYHGPGQLVVYCLFYLKQMASGVSSLVRKLEQQIMQVLECYGISGHLVPGAPGVYVRHKKIASLGLRVSRFCCYHGFALNVHMDLEPFTLIHPCGYPDLQVTHIAEWLDPAVKVPDLSHVIRTTKSVFDLW